MLEDYDIFDIEFLKDCYEPTIDLTFDYLTELLPKTDCLSYIYFSLLFSCLINPCARLDLLTRSFSICLCKSTSPFNRLISSACF
jgi:hypothetical protein